MENVIVRNRKPDGQRGFSLIELLIVLVVLGIIAAIAVANLLAALDKGKQKRTMMELRTISSAVETYHIDRGIYPIGNTIGVLEAAISPDYLKTMTTRDAWNNSLQYNDGGTSGQGYTIGSGGKNGGPLNFVGAGGPTTRYDDAIIITDGAFAQWPEGIQVN